MNYRLLLQYDGTDFHGWQMQGDLRTVQGELTRALSLLDNNEVVVHGSGRTDAGVHAEGQVATVQLRREISPQKLRNAINANIDTDTRVIFAATAADNFHARYSAVAKTYVYRIVNAPSISPFWFRYAHHEMRPLDVPLMRECARHFVGEHDWSAFSAAQADVKSRVRIVQRIEVADGWDARGRCRLIEITITANGFLRYMVRSIAGALLEVGIRKQQIETVVDAIRHPAKESVSATAPAKGLTLLSAHY